VSVQSFRAENFRCLADIEVEPAADYNLFYGANASGKTSILEAIAYLGRGKSFRGAAPADLVRHGQKAFTLFGAIESGDRTARVGVRNSSAGMEVRVDGVSGGGAAALATALPLQIIDPDIHNLVAGAPDERRRYLDWIAFHVEHDYLAVWRRFRRALKQRNAALRNNAAPDVIHRWSAEFAVLAEQIDAGRRHALLAAGEALEGIAADLLGDEVCFEYQPGWPQDRSLETLLEQGLDRELQQGSTQYGPHRADLKLTYDERRARKLVSRGQQKLLACAMVLGATETAQVALERPMLLLLDDPAAELDGDSLGRLMRRAVTLGCQIVATSLQPDVQLFPTPAAMFHVERGGVTRVG
jgi:DNA replication and repair protein RecF